MATKDNVAPEKPDKRAPRSDKMPYLPKGAAHMDDRFPPMTIRRNILGSIHPAELFAWAKSIVPSFEPSGNFGEAKNNAVDVIIAHEYAEPENGKPKVKGKAKAEEPEANEAQEAEEPEAKVEEGE